MHLITYRALSFVTLLAGRKSCVEPLKKSSKRALQWKSPKRACKCVMVLRTTAELFDSLSKQSIWRILFEENLGQLDDVSTISPHLGAGHEIAEEVNE